MTTENEYSPNYQQFLPESKKDEKWYKDTMRRIIKEYEESNYNSIFDEQPDFVEEYIRHLKYYYGKQDNVDYAFHEQVIPGVTSPATWLAGQKISSLIDHLRGKILSQITGYKVSARATSKDLVKKREELFEKIQAEWEMRPEFDRMAQATGVPYQPAQGFKPNSQDDINRFKNVDYKETAERVCATFAKDAMYRNHFTEILPRVFFDAVVGGTGTLKIYVQNGKVKWDLVTVPEAMIDRSQNSDVNRGAKLGGRRRYLTIAEIAQEYGLNETQIAELRDIASKEDSWNKYNAGYSTQWWKKKGKEPLIFVADLEWLDLKLLKYEKSEDKYGNQHIVKGKKNSISEAEKERKKKELIKKPITTVRQGILIGNCMMLECGERTNLVRSYKNLADTEISYHSFTPFMKDGQTNSIAGRLKGHQDRIDLYRFKIQEAVKRDKGKKFTFDVSQLDGKTHAHYSDLIVDLQTLDIIPYNSLADESSANRPPSGKYIDVVDLTIDDKTVNAYIMLIAQEKREMEEIVNIPQIALGQQQSIVGKGVQENTVAYSETGTAPLFRSFIDYVNKILQYSANLAKIQYTMEDNYEGQFMVSESDMAFLKFSKGLLFEECDVRINVDDIVSEQQKNSLLATAQAWAQNDKLNPLDYIIMLKSDSFTEIQNQFEGSLRKQEEAAIMKQQLADKQAQMMQQQQIQGQQQSHMAGLVADNAQTAMKAKAGIIQEGMRQEGAKAVSE